MRRYTRAQTQTNLHVLTFDVINNKIQDKKIYPTAITQKEFSWLYASNNKYPKDPITADKTGKWMLFIPREQVNSIWDKIIKGILTQDLWHAKVSTVNEDSTHAIMVYTKDYSNLADIIRVLDYLEANNIKPKDTNIRYKTDQQTRAGIYAGSPEKPWIYESKTIRSQLFTTSESDNNTLASLPSRTGLYVIPALRKATDLNGRHLSPPQPFTKSIDSHP